MVRTLRARQAIAALFALAVLGGATASVSAAQVTILTNGGKIAQGSLSGISPVIRLLKVDAVTSIGPGQQFDIPLSAIRQITLDFPRMVVETADRTLIGPYSAFRGIAQALQLDRPGEPRVTIPTSSLRAIAFHGHPLRPVSRVWLGDRFLSMPEISSATAFSAAECEECTITTPVTVSDPDLAVVWDGSYPETAPEPPSELPWWVGLLGIAAMIVVAFLLTSSLGSSP